MFKLVVFRFQLKLFAIFVLPFSIIRKFVEKLKKCPTRRNFSSEIESIVFIGLLHSSVSVVKSDAEEEEDVEEKERRTSVVQKK